VSTLGKSMVRREHRSMNPPGPTPEQLARHLQKLREQGSMTIEQLAERSGLALDRVIMIESGTVDQSVEEVAQYAMGLGMNLSEVFRSWERGLN
jgi:transcriptional regulator with XRE-family HTH domain